MCVCSCGCKYPGRAVGRPYTQSYPPSPQCHTEHETAWSNNEENTMNLDEPPRPPTRLYSHAPRFQYDEQTKIHNVTTLHHHSCIPILVHLCQSFYLRGLPSPSDSDRILADTRPCLIPTPPMHTVILPPHSLFTAPLDLPEPQPSQQQQAPPRRSRFTMGPRPDCEKCRLGVPGHYAHFD
ncbi:hypothetical protein EI94DRAFT_489129 [Lactarius quietus]|nr:hypothetical protein EI94DRAFT_489129 [Lactarius quietus]